MSFLEKVDPKVSQAIDLETRRQAGKIELIASENFVSEAVLEAQGFIDEPEIEAAPYPFCPV